MVSFLALREDYRVITTSELVKLYTCKPRNMMKVGESKADFIGVGTYFGNKTKNTRHRKSMKSEGS